MDWRSIGILSDPMGVLVGLVRRVLKTDIGERMATLESQNISFECRMNRFSLDALQDLHLQNPHRPEPLVFAAALLAEKQEWERVAQVTALLRRRFPAEMEGFRLGADAARSLQRFDESERLALATARRFPNRAEGLLLHAIVAEVKGDKPEMVRRWDRARRRFPKHRWAWTRSVDLAFEAGHTDEADRLMTRMLTDFADDPGVWRHAAELEERRGDWHAAVEGWAQGRARFPGTPAFYAFGARALRHLGEANAAAALVVTASFLFPRDPDVLAERAEITRLGLDPGPLPETRE